MKSDYIIVQNPELSYKLIENNCCSYFGCGRQLTRQEALFGNRCIDHQNNDENKIFKVIGKLKNNGSKI